MVETTVTDSIYGSPSIFRVASAATTNATLVKAFSGNLFGFVLLGTQATAQTDYVKFYDMNTVPVVGTSPVLFTVPVISTTTLAGFVQVAFDYGIPFKNGIAFSITGGVADSDTTALLSANLVHGFILYK